MRHSNLSRYASIGMIILGIFTLLFVSGFFGIILTVIGVVMYRIYGRQSKATRSSSVPPGATAPSTAEMVACKYCGTLNDPSRSKCVSCGASLR